MQLFTQNKSQLSSLKEKPFKLEKDIQKLFETNLSAISGLQLVKSEFTVKAQRLDTLTFDEDANAFVYKADFIVEYNEIRQS